MDDRRLHLALREMQVHFTNVRVVVVLLAVAVVLGIAGPFGTYDLLPLVPRVAYWIGMTFATYVVGYAAGALLNAYAGERIGNGVLRVVAVGVACGVPVTLAVMALNVAVFGPNGWAVVDPPMLLASVIVISMAIATMLRLLEAEPRRAGLSTIGAAPAAPAPPPPPPPILERLPPAQRGRLLALSVEDHYVDIVTDRGHGLVLMRLVDAIRETGTTPGVQIHRSHWVSRDAVRRSLRVDGRPMVELTDGRRLPVARGQLAAARAAGIRV